MASQRYVSYTTPRGTTPNAASGIVSSCLDAPASSAESAEALAVDSALDGPAFQALDRLSENQRNVMILRTIADLSIDQVADVLGIKPNAVKQLQHRAVKQLRKQLNNPVTQ